MRGDDYQRIGVAFEAPTHFLKLTALENLRYFARLYRGPARDPRALLAELDLGEGADNSWRPTAIKTRSTKAAA